MKIKKVFYEIVDFFVLDMYSKPIFCSKVAQKGKLFSRLLEHKKLLQHQKLLKSCRAQLGQALMMADRCGSVVVRVSCREIRIQRLRVRREVRV